MDLSACQFPDQPAVDSPKEEVAFFSFFPGAFDVVQDPFDFRAREISVDDQARLVTKFIDQAAGLEVFANRGGLTGLPDDGVVHGVARVLIPDDCRFTLVGDADGRDFTGCHIGLCQGFAHDFDHAVENFIGIVFDPARFREILGEFLLADADDMRFIIENNSAITRGAGVQGHNILLLLHNKIAPFVNDTDTFFRYLHKGFSVGSSYIRRHIFSTKY